MLPVLLTTDAPHGGGICFLQLNLIQLLRGIVSCEHLYRQTPTVPPAAAKARQRTKIPPSLSSIQCFGALSLFKCFFGPRTIFK